MGTVYLAKDSVNDRYVAIKELNLILKADSELVKDFAMKQNCRQNLAMRISSVCTAFLSKMGVIIWRWNMQRAGL